MKPKTVGRTQGGIAAEVPSHINGLMAESIILTLDGEKPVGDVKPGDRVITRDAGMAVVTGLRKRTVKARAVTIAAGSLGHTRPERDVLLPAGQPVLVRDWRAEALFGARQAIVPAARLIDGEFIRDVGDVEMTLCEITFDRAHVLYVDGLEVAGHPHPAVAEAA